MYGIHQQGAIVSCIVTSVTFCVCSAVTSLLGACCGNDKASTIAPGAQSGRKRSVVLLLLSIGLAFAYQYGVAHFILHTLRTTTTTASSTTTTTTTMTEYNTMNLNAVAAYVPGVNYVVDCWLSGCTQYDYSEELLARCVGHSGVYRSALSAFLFFIVAALAVVCKRTANREAWPAKYIVFLVVTIGMIFVPNTPLFVDVYLTIARIGAIIFILFQQIVLVDIAHNWNDGWVVRADHADTEHSGAGKKWLIAIVVSAGLLFVSSLVGWGLLYAYFGGTTSCTTNTILITMTIVLSLLITVAQLSGTEGSLLASSLITSYATMLCYNAVTRNPNPVCNPTLVGGDNSSDTLSMIIGLGLTIVSLCYVGWSTTADSTLGGNNSSSNNNENDIDIDTTNNDQEQRASSSKISGVVINTYDSTTMDSDDVDGTVREEDRNVDASTTNTSDTIPNNFSNNWKLNIALAAVTCWYSMVLTSFGAIAGADGTVANPQVGTINMWIIIGSQWCALLLYTWTLVAPRLFPDRDFS